jgi:hypothetical protein
MKVLILSSAKDMHARAVANKLSDLGAEYVIWRFDDMVERTRVRFDLTSSGPTCLFRTEDGQEIDFNQFQSIWNRRPGSFHAGHFPMPFVQGMIETEAQHAMAGILRSVNCLWVNHPGRDAEARYKLWQLEAARRAGFSIPETLITNEPEEVREFYKAADERVVYKLISEGTNFNMPNYEFPLGVPTLPLRKVDLPHLEQVKFAPHLFQRCIDKAYDLRVTIIGQRIFPVKIHSQTGRGKVDWRMDYGVEMELVEMPAAVNESCLALQRMLGLNYGAMDIVVDSQGRHFFIEVNCAGQYLWLEDKAKLDLSLELARLLVGQSPPLVT